MPPSLANPEPARASAQSMLGDKPIHPALPQPRQPILVTSVILPSQPMSQKQSTEEVLRNALAAMGHPQQATDVITDNEVALSIATGTIKQKRSRSVETPFTGCIDMTRFGSGDLQCTGNRAAAI
jgi:hypothetical protein